MIGEIVSFGLNLATMPARLAFKGVQSALALPSDFNQFIKEVREASDEVALEIQQMMDDVDQEMNQQAGFLSPQKKQQAAELALNTAEQHLNMAVKNIFRAIWLAGIPQQLLSDKKAGDIIEHKR